MVDNNAFSSSISKLDTIYNALACSTRRAILEHLAQAGVQKVSDLARPFAITKQAITKHLKVLERAGLIRREIHGREHRCSLEAQPLHDAINWFEHSRVLWKSSLDSLGTYLEEVQLEPHEEQRTNIEETR